VILIHPLLASNSFASLIWFVESSAISKTADMQIRITKASDSAKRIDWMMRDNPAFSLILIKSSLPNLMENSIQHGKYRWDLVLDESTMKNDEVYGITEYGYDTLDLTPDNRFVYKHFNSYSS